MEPTGARMGGTTGRGAHPCSHRQRMGRAAGSARRPAAADRRSGVGRVSAGGPSERARARVGIARRAGMGRAED